MIDIHCHILPGIDDGSPDMEMSLVMAQLAEKDGIHTIIATPHFDGNNLTRNQIEQSVAALNTALSKSHIAVRILPGAEVQSHAALTHAEQFCLADSRFLLLEFPYTYLPANSLDIVRELLNQNITPIIAHPERHPIICQDPTALKPFLNCAAKSQITAESLTGQLGPNAQSCAIWLLKNNMVHYLATDSHSPSFRKPVLGKAVKNAAKIIGKSQAQKLVSGSDIIPSFSLQSSA